MKLEDNKVSDSIPRLEEDFYSSLPISQSYQDALGNARPIPFDWSLGLADIVDSTQAILEGKYKEVNIAGAMGIMALGNLFETLKRPFIFGGDGMSFLIPPGWEQQAKNVLSKVIWDVEQLFQLQMRAAVIPLSFLNMSEQDFQVAKVKVSKTYQQAFFLGSGPEKAEELLKTTPSTIQPFIIQPKADLFASYEGFSCRWRDVPSPKGETAALIVQPRGTKSLGFLYGEIERIIGAFENNHPLSPYSMKLAGKKSSWNTQISVLSQGKPKGYSVMEGMKQWFILGIMKFSLRFKVPIKHALYDLSRVNEMNVESSDVHKIDSGIKMILSSETQTFDRLVQRLEQLRAQGMIYFGIHRTSAAHITCIASLGSGDDIHFVDATGGGYALAAVQLKEQKLLDKLGSDQVTERRFDTLAVVYEDLFPLGPKTLEFILTHTQSYSKVLDLGSSTGQLARTLASHKRQCVGIDMSAESIQLAKLKIKNVQSSEPLDLRFLQGDIFQLASLLDPEERFQTILCLGNTLAHARDMDQVENLFQDMFSSLEIGGACIISMLHYDSILTEPEFDFPVIQTGSHTFIRSYEPLQNGVIPFKTKLYTADTLISEEVSTLLPISVKQLDRIVKKVGFSHVSWYKDFEYTVLETDSTMVVGVFTKNQ